MAPFETIYIDEMVAACDGGERGGPLDHPKVYLNLALAGRAECPYCSRLFVNRAMAAPSAEPRPPAAVESNRPQNGPKSATSG